MLAPELRVSLLADRGFGDQRLYSLLSALGWDYVVRFRGCILVEDAKGTTRPASDWVRADGRATAMRGAKVTEDKAAVPAVVLVHARGMKEAWCLATSRGEWTAAEVVKLYSRRFTIEETFRDQKDIRFGLGLSVTHIGRTDCRDRLLYSLRRRARASYAPGRCKRGIGVGQDAQVECQQTPNPLALLARYLLVQAAERYATGLVRALDARFRPNRSRPSVCDSDARKRVRNEGIY